MPLFVVIEGVDRCGKSLQGELLLGRILARGARASLHTTPDYSSLAGKLASGMLSGSLQLTSLFCGKKSPLDPLALECAAVCDRYVVASRVRESLLKGKHAVCVRWWQSALVYGADDALDREFILDACSSLPWPDLNVLLDVGVDDVRSRLDPGKRYESDPEQQRRLAGAYLDLWRQRGGSEGTDRWPVVNGSGNPDEVAARIWEVVSRRLP